MAEDALGGVLAVAGVAVHLDIHRADLKAFAALYALALVAAHTQQRIVTHRLQEDRDGADIFAEGAVVFQHQGEDDADHIIEYVAGDKKVEHRRFVRLAEVSHSATAMASKTKNRMIADLYFLIEES